MLFNFALIKRQGNEVSLHRLVQKAFIDSPHGYGSSGCQKGLDAAATLVNHHFPKMGGSLSLFERWSDCTPYLPHALSLAKVYKTPQQSKQRLKSSADLDELLKNCAWYLFEIGEFGESLMLLDIAFDACEDKEGLIYAQLCNNAACIYYELNDLVRCRESNELARKIREEKLKSDDVDLANTYSNIGCLLLSERRLDDSVEMYRRAEEIEVKHAGDDPNYLCMTLLCLGRVYSVKKDFETAQSYYDRAKKMAPPDTWVMAM